MAKFEIKNLKDLQGLYDEYLSSLNSVAPSDDKTGYKQPVKKNVMKLPDKKPPVDKAPEKKEKKNKSKPIIRNKPIKDKKNAIEFYHGAKKTKIHLEPMSSTPIMPRVLSLIGICNKCKTDISNDYIVSNVVIFGDKERFVKVGYVQVLLPFCVKCECVSIKSYDVLFYNNIEDHYFKLNGKHKIETSKLYSLVPCELKVSFTNVGVSHRLTKEENQDRVNRSTKKINPDGYVPEKDVKCAVIKKEEFPNREKDIAKEYRSKLGAFEYVDLLPRGELYPIYLCFAEIGCQRKDHDIECIIAHVASTSEIDYIPINIFYCTKCEKPFIRNNSYQNYLDIYGDLLLRPIRFGCSAIENAYYYDEYGNLKETSEIFDYGYSVREGVSALERQRALMKIIEFGFMKKTTVINTIENQIDFCKNNPKHFNANYRRRDALFFLNDYAVNRQHEVFGYIITMAKNYGFVQ